MCNEENKGINAYSDIASTYAIPRNRVFTTITENNNSCKPNQVFIITIINVN